MYVCMYVCIYIYIYTYINIYTHVVLSIYLYGIRPEDIMPEPRSDEWSATARGARVHGVSLLVYTRDSARSDIAWRSQEQRSCSCCSIFHEVPFIGFAVFTCYSMRFHEVL